MQAVLQGYLGLLQGEKLHLYSIKNDREITMVIYMVYKTKKHKRFNFIIFLTFFSS